MHPILVIYLSGCSTHSLPTHFMPRQGVGPLPKLHWSDPLTLKYEALLGVGTAAGAALHTPGTMRGLSFRLCCLNPCSLLTWTFLSPNCSGCSFPLWHISYLSNSILHLFVCLFVFIFYFIFLISQNPFLKPKNAKRYQGPKY